MDVFPQLSVDRGIPIPLAEQLTSRIREAILAGGIAPGEPLPASRALAGRQAGARAAANGGAA